MKKKGTIVQYSAKEIDEMLAKGHDQTDWERLRNMTEEEVERNALEDNRRHGIPDDWYEDAVLMKGPPTEPISTPSTVMDRTAVWKGRIEDAPSDYEYWQQQSFEKRLMALESIRQEYHGWRDDSQPRLQRVCRIVEQT